MSLLIFLNLRLVSLAPSITETLYYIGFGKYLVGNTVYCNYPKEAKNITHVGNLINPNIETLKKLKPDYIILINPMQKRVGLKLKKAGFKTISCRQTSFRDILDCMYKLGKLGNDTTGYVKFKKSLSSLDTLSFAHKPSVVFILSKKPLYVAGQNTFIDEIIKKAGGKNAILLNDYSILSEEELVKTNPDIIILSFYNSKDTEFRQGIGLNKVKAIENGCIFNVNPDIYTRPGPRIIQAVKELHKLIKECN